MFTFFAYILFIFYIFCFYFVNFSTKYGTTEEREITEESHGLLGDIKQLLQSFFKAMFKSRPDHKRLLLWIFLFNYTFYVFTYNGTEGTHRYLYAKLEYGWTEQEYTEFSAIYKLCYAFVLLVILPLSSR